MSISPLAESAASDAEDCALVVRAKGGNRDALEGTSSPHFDGCWRPQTSSAPRRSLEAWRAIAFSFRSIVSVTSMTRADCSRDGQ